MDGFFDLTPTGGWEEAGGRDPAGNQHLLGPIATPVSGKEGRIAPIISTPACQWVFSRVWSTFGNAVSLVSLNDHTVPLQACVGGNAVMSLRQAAGRGFALGLILNVPGRGQALS